MRTDVADYSHCPTLPCLLLHAGPKPFSNKAKENHSALVSVRYSVFTSQTLSDVVGEVLHPSDLELPGQLRQDVSGIGHESPLPCVPGHQGNCQFG